MSLGRRSRSHSVIREAVYGGVRSGFGALYLQSFGYVQSHCVNRSKPIHILETIHGSILKNTLADQNTTGLVQEIAT